MRLLKIGAEEARRLGHPWMGPEHTLLGILRSDSDDMARRALERTGVDAAMVTKKGEEKSGITPNPRWHTILGRAEGISIGLGADETGTVQRRPPLRLG